MGRQPVASTSQNTRVSAAACVLLVSSGVSACGWGSSWFKRDKTRQNASVSADLPAADQQPKPAPLPLVNLARVPSLAVPRLPKDTTLVLDGNLDEPAWASAAMTANFVEPSLGEFNADLPVQGRARLLWDDTGFYVGCTVTDVNLTAGFKPKVADQALWTEDTVELMIDPEGDGDNKDYYEIQVNPQNLVFDSHFDTYNHPRDETAKTFGHQSWASNLKSAVKLEGTLNFAADRDHGYTVEIFVPWKAFHLAKQSPPLVGDTWRMNVYAIERNAGAAWSPILGQGNFHKASRFGRVTWMASSSVVSQQSVRSTGEPRARILPVDRRGMLSSRRLQSAPNVQARIERLFVDPPPK